MTRTATAPGKIIVSGDYAVVFGYPGIAIPASLVLTATFEERPSTSGVTIEWPGINDLWKQYLAHIIAECAAQKGDAIRGHLTITNQIPPGKGMGSSTALVVAVSRALLGEDCKEQAKRIEDTVNPGNSGLDFAVIWGARPVIFRKSESPKPLTLRIELPNADLIDTGTPGETTMELVAWMKSRAEDPAIKQALATIGQCTERLLGGESPLTVFPDHHRAQVALGVVLPKVQEIVRSIEQAGGAAKVIGAGGRTGGSGMVLAIQF